MRTLIKILWNILFVLIPVFWICQGYYVTRSFSFFPHLTLFYLYIMFLIYPFQHFLLRIYPEKGKKHYDYTVDYFSIRFDQRYINLACSISIISFATLYLIFERSHVPRIKIFFIYLGEVLLLLLSLKMFITIPWIKILDKGILVKRIWPMKEIVKWGNIRIHLKYKEYFFLHYTFDPRFVNIEIVNESFWKKNIRVIARFKDYDKFVDKLLEHIPEERITSDPEYEEYMARKKGGMNNE
jgi:hypothetical protein